MDNGQHINHYQRPQGDAKKGHRPRQVKQIVLPAAVTKHTVIKNTKLFYCRTQYYISTIIIITVSDDYV